MKKNYNISLSLRINIGNDTFLASGKVELLIKIKEMGSLRKAAEKMKMSYRKAWFSINKINNLASEPVVILKRGGKNGGVATITDYGNRLISKYISLRKDVDKFISENSRKYDFNK